MLEDPLDEIVSEVRDWAKGWAYVISEQPYVQWDVGRRNMLRAIRELLDVWMFQEEQLQGHLQRELQRLQMSQRQDPV